ncbi:hypothetical protein D3C78_1570070 [compost metagenome]
MLRPARLLLTAWLDLRQGNTNKGKPVQQEGAVQIQESSGFGLHSAIFAKIQRQLLSNGCAVLVELQLLQLAIQVILDGRLADPLRQNANACSHIHKG